MSLLALLGLVALPKSIDGTLDAATTEAPGDRWP
jgi:hypothetical protein